MKSCIGFTIPDDVCRWMAGIDNRQYIQGMYDAKKVRVRCLSTMREVKGQLDYSQANSSASRGVSVWFVLNPGRYQVQGWDLSGPINCTIQAKNGEVFYE